MAELAVDVDPQSADNAMAPAMGEGMTPAPKVAAMKTPKKVIDHFRNESQKSKNHRRQYSQRWKTSVDLRLGRTGVIYTAGYPTPDGDDIQTEINPDWYLTKVKTANLYSQTPAVQLTHESKNYMPAIAPMAKAINYELSDKRTNIGVPMEEVLNDVVNAAGIGGIIVGYTARFVNKSLPTEDLSHLPEEEQSNVLQQGLVGSEDIPQVASYKFYADRISPTDLLWPAPFVGSDFNNADWIGHTGRMGWADAKLEFKLTDDQKEAVITNTEKSAQDDLRGMPDQGVNTFMAYEAVKYDEIFYWRHRVDPEESNLKSIWRIVFVDGIPDRPVIDEQWKGQIIAAENGVPQIIGAMKFPIQFLTLTYITDNPIPPSDSEAGRPQVNDLRRSRRQMFMNRDRSRPIRWFDVNRVDRTIQDNLMRGDWQGFIPTIGDGARSIGEIARASYPPEDYNFDRQTQADLQTVWMIGSNQTGALSSGEKTKAEVETTQENFATRIGQERARVSKFFLNLVEVIAGLMALYSDFPNLTPEEHQAMETAWNRRMILGDLVFRIRPDSTIMLDVGQRIERLTKFLNITAQTGVVDIRPIIAEIAELTGLDPALVMKEPEPPKPEQAAISFRFTGKEDLFNPLVMALLAQQQQAPSPEALATAQKILLAAQSAMPVQPPPPAPVDPNAAPTTPGEPNHPDPGGLAPKIAQRSADMGNA